MPINPDLDRLNSLFDDEEDQPPVLHLTPVWSEHIHLDMRCDEDLCFIGWHEGQLIAWLKRPVFNPPLPLSFPVHMAPPLADDLGMRIFEIRKLGPGTWVLNPSLLVPELHAYIVFCEVPEPAPWVAVKGGR